MRLITAFDLEMNQPSGKIISIGAVLGDIDTGVIIDELHLFVKIDEKLCTDPKICDIVKLTGITDEVLQTDGISLEEAYHKLVKFRERSHFRNPVVWGAGDSRALKSQLEELGIKFNAGFRVGDTDEIPYCFGFREFDCKQLFQLFCIKDEISLQSGLKKSMNRAGIKFQGRSHIAVDDARNTFYFFQFLLEKLSLIPEFIQGNKSEHK